MCWKTLFAETKTFDSGWFWMMSLTDSKYIGWSVKFILAAFCNRIEASSITDQGMYKM